MTIYVVHTKRTDTVTKIYVGRPTVLGNPFTHLARSTKADVQVASVTEAVMAYEDYFYNKVDEGTDEPFLEALENIFQAAQAGDVHLACWCKDELKPYNSDYKICHADVIRNFINDSLEEI